jgi:hypothetical protein
MAEPQVMARFVAEVEAAPPPGLAGLVWFRLPTGDDRRAWSLSTWLAVLERKPLKGGLAVQLVAGQSNAPADIRIDNAGNADLPLPLRVRLHRVTPPLQGTSAAVTASMATRSKAMPGDATCAWARPACCAPAAAAPSDGCAVPTARRPPNSHWKWDPDDQHEVFCRCPPRHGPAQPARLGRMTKIACAASSLLVLGAAVVACGPDFRCSCWMTAPVPSAIRPPTPSPGKPPIW